MRKVVVAAVFAASPAVAWAQAPESTEAELVEAFTTCSVVWDVAAMVALRAQQDAELPFFRERAEESRVAAHVTAPGMARARLASIRETILPDLRLLALSDPRAFKDGPYRSCANLAGTAAALAKRDGVQGSAQVLID